MFFISHAWVNGKPDPKVLQFVELLRSRGYQAECDVLYQQQKTAIHFHEMMADALRKAEKTIIVLSEGYRERADNFQGGVGTEYRYIIEDFSQNENKYILVSFGGRSPKIIPNFLKGRDIVDLLEDEKHDYGELFSKLSNSPKYEFSPVSAQRTVPLPQKIEPLQLRTTNDLARKLDLDFSKTQPMSDLQKKRYLKRSFDHIIELIKGVSAEFCSQNQHFQIECEEIDSVTVVFDIYKDEKNVHSIQIWLGNLMGSHKNNIFVGNSIGSKNSFSQMIGCKEVDGRPVLDITAVMFLGKSDGTVEDVVKHIWEDNFQLYLRR